MSEEITLRPATIRDADLLLAWRNDPETREASRRTTRIRRAEHLQWLESVLKDDKRELYIAEENGVPAGSVRADFSDGAWELSWTTAPAARGRGVAKRMVAQFAGRISDPICAEVKEGNKASARIAEHAGMRFDHERDGMLYYHRPAVNT